MLTITDVRDDIIDAATEVGEQPWEFVLRATTGPHPAEVMFARLYPALVPDAVDMYVTAEGMKLAGRVRPLPRVIGAATDNRWIYDPADVPSHDSRLVSYEPDGTSVRAVSADTREVHDARLRAR